VEAGNFAELDGVDDEASVAVAGEPGAVLLVGGFVAIADVVGFDGGVAADVENGGEWGLDFFGEPEVGGDVEVRAGLEMDFFDDDGVVFEATCNGGMEVAAFGHGREAEHIEEFGLAAGAGFGIVKVGKSGG